MTTAKHNRPASHHPALTHGLPANRPTQLQRAQRAPQPLQPQAGVALLTSIIFLLILSIIGISSMQDSSFDQRMTTNSQNMLSAFQHAESGLAAALRDPTAFTLSNTPDSPRVLHLCQSGTPGSCNDTSDTLNTRIEVYYLRAINRTPIGYSLDSRTVEHLFEIRSDGRSGNAVSVHRQGLTIPGPG